MVASRKKATGPRSKAVRDKQPRPKKKQEADPPSRALALVPNPSQAGMFDHELTSDAMYDLIASKHRLQDAARAYNKVQKEFRGSFKTLCKEQKIKDGHRIRIQPMTVDDLHPPYSMAAKMRKGGGHSVETWESLGAVDIHKLVTP